MDEKRDLDVHDYLSLKKTNPNLQLNLTKRKAQNDESCIFDEDMIWNPPNDADMKNCKLSTVSYSKKSRQGIVDA
jgi:hypothetical protein